MPLIKISLFFAVISLASTEALAQVTKPASADQDILAIRSAYQAINATHPKKQHFTYEAENCAEEGVVDYYFDHNTIVKIVESGAIGDGSWVNEYYYRSGKVIFCFETLVGGPAIGKVSKTEYRVYVKDGRPIRTMDGKKIVPADTKTTTFIQTANKIYKAYATKNFASALCN